MGEGLVLVGFEWGVEERGRMKGERGTCMSAYEVACGLRWLLEGRSDPTGMEMINYKNVAVLEREGRSHLWTLYSLELVLCLLVQRSNFFGVCLCHRLRSRV